MDIFIFCSVACPFTKLFGFICQCGFIFFNRECYHHKSILTNTLHCNMKFALKANSVEKDR